MNGKLPLPKALKLNDRKLSPKLYPDDEPHCKEEEVFRLYPHVRGQWTVFIYVNVKVELVEELVEIISLSSFLTPCLSFHLSLLRGHYALRHHHIEPFLRLVRDLVKSIDKFSFCLSKLNVFTNENRSKCFLCLSSPFTLKEQLQPELRNLVQSIRRSLLQIDQSCELQVGAGNLLDDFILHTSLAWAAIECEPQARQFAQTLQETIDDPITIKVSRIQVKIGNQEHEIEFGG